MEDLQYKELCSLAIAIYNRRYKTQNPTFELCPDSLGVITQIDNMVAGILIELEQLSCAVKPDPIVRFGRKGIDE